MPRKRTKDATAHTARNGSKSRSRPNSDENEGIDQFVQKNDGGERMNKLGHSTGTGRKKSLQDQTHASATATRAFATEIQNFLGNTRSGSQLRGLRTDGGDISDNAEWYAYAQANCGLRVSSVRGVTRETTSEMIPAEKGHVDAEANAKNPVLLTEQFEDLSVKDDFVPGSSTKDTHIDTLQPLDVFSDLSVGYNATSSIFSSSQRYTRHATSIIRSTSRANSSSALKRSASATCLFCKARFAPRPRSRSGSQPQQNTTSSSSSSTSLAVSSSLRCQCHRYSKVFDQRNSFRSIAQQSTPVKARAKKSCYKIDISSPDVYGSLMDLGSADSQMDPGTLHPRSSQSGLETLYQESQSGTQMTMLGSQGSVVAEALGQLTQQLVECMLSSSPSSSCPSDTSSGDDEEHEVESLLGNGLHNNSAESHSLSPEVKKPRQHNPALLSPSLGYIPIAFPMSSKDFPY